MYTNNVCSEYVDEIPDFHKSKENVIKKYVERKELKIPPLQLYHTLIVSVDYFLQKEKKVDADKNPSNLIGYGVSFEVYNEKRLGLQLFEIKENKEERELNALKNPLSILEFIYKYPIYSTSKDPIFNTLYPTKETLLMRCFKIQLLKRYAKLSRDNKFIQLTVRKGYSLIQNKRQSRRFRKASILKKISKYFSVQVYFTEIVPTNGLLQIRTFHRKKEHMSELKKFLFSSRLDPTRLIHSLRNPQMEDNKNNAEEYKMNKNKRKENDQTEWSATLYTMVLEELETCDESTEEESMDKVSSTYLNATEECMMLQKEESIKNEQFRIVVDDQLKYEVFYPQAEKKNTEISNPSLCGMVYFLYPCQKSFIESAKTFVHKNKTVEESSMVHTSRNRSNIIDYIEEEYMNNRNENPMSKDNYLTSRNHFEVTSSTCFRNHSSYCVSSVPTYNNVENDKNSSTVPHVFYDNVCLISPLKKEHIINNYYKKRSDGTKQNRRKKCESHDNRMHSNTYSNNTYNHRYSNTYSNTCSKTSSNTNSNTCSSNTYSKLSSNTYTSACENNYDTMRQSRNFSNTFEDLGRLQNPQRRISRISKREDESESTPVEPKEVINEESSIFKASKSFFKTNKEEVCSKKKRNSPSCKSMLPMNKITKKRRVSHSKKFQNRFISESEDNRNEEEEWINNQTPIIKTKKENASNYDPYEEYLSYTSVSKSIPKRRENTTTAIASVEKNKRCSQVACSFMMESQFHNELYEKLLEVEMSESKESYMNNRMREKLASVEDSGESTSQGKRKGTNVGFVDGNEFIDEGSRRGKKRRKQTSEMDYEDEIRENSINALLSNSVDDLLEDSEDFQSLQYMNRCGSTVTEGGEVAVMERHSSILVNRGIRTKKYVDYSLYNTYAKSSFLQCAEQADNHHIGNYLEAFKDKNFGHIRQKVKLNISRTFTNLQTTSETCVLHFTNLIFDLYISRFNSKEEILESIVGDLVSGEKQFSEVMIQLLKEYYPKLHQEYLYKEQLKKKYTDLLHDLKESYDLIYHFIAVVCLFISQKYYNYRLISVDMIAKTYSKSHLEGLQQGRKSGSGRGTEEKTTDYYSVAAYLDTTFTHFSVNKNFALEVEVCILKKLNYDLAIPTTYSLLDSLLKANENISFLKTRNDYNTAEGEILLRIASIDNVFLKYKTSTIAMAIYEILNFNICKDQMQKEMFDVNSLYSRNSLAMRNPEQGTVDRERDMSTGKDLTLLKRQARSLIIAEEEDRFLTASKYLKDKSKLNHLTKKILMRICESIHKKFPKFYEAYEHQMAQKLSKYVKRFQKSKLKYIQKLQRRKFRRQQLKKERENKGLIKEEKGEKKEPVEPVHIKVKEEQKEEPPIKGIEKKEKQKSKKQKKDKKLKKKKKEKLLIDENIEETLEHDEPLQINESNKLYAKENIPINTQESKFLHMKKKLLKNMRKYVKKVEKLSYTEIPHKYCSAYLLQGKDIKVYIKRESEDHKKKNSSNSSNKETSQGEGTQKEKHNYIIGSKTKSTDAHLVDYYNYVSKLRIQLMKGLKYFIKRIKKIKNVEVCVRRTDSEFFIKKKMSKKKKKKQLKMVKKNIPLVKQLLNEIKLFFIWIYKLSNIEIRPLIKFGDLRFMSLVKLYKRNYSSYVEKLINITVQMNKNAGKGSSGSSRKKKGSAKVDYSRNNKGMIDEFSQQMKNEKMKKKYIEELLKPVQEEATTFDEFVKSDALREKKGIRLLMKDQNLSNVYEQTADNNLEGSKEEAENEGKEEDDEEENEDTTVSGLEELAITVSQKKRNDNSINKISFCENIQRQIIEMNESDRSNRSSIGMSSCYPHQNNMMKESIFGNSSFPKKANEGSDWITINDPQVDECAKELMEAFLKWKHKNFISKNWTFHEYPDSRDFYYSLIFGDLKTSESLKYINEMMNMKYIHLLKIYKDGGAMVHLLDEL